MLACSFQNLCISYRKVSRQYVLLCYFSKCGKAAVKIAEERGHVVIPRRKPGFLTQIGVASGALQVLCHVLGLIATLMLQLVLSIFSSHVLIPSEITIQRMRTIYEQDNADIYSTVYSAL